MCKTLHFRQARSLPRRCSVWKPHSLTRTETMSGSTRALTWLASMVPFTRTETLQALASSRETVAAPRTFWMNSAREATVGPHPSHLSSFPVQNIQMNIGLKLRSFWALKTRSQVVGCHSTSMMRRQRPVLWSWRSWFTWPSQSLSWSWFTNTARRRKWCTEIDYQKKMKDEGVLVRLK